MGCSNLKVKQQYRLQWLKNLYGVTGFQMPLIGHLGVQLFIM